MTSSPSLFRSVYTPTVYDKIEGAKAEHWPQLALIEYAQKHCEFDRLESEVQWQIVYATKAQLHPDGVLLGDEYDFSKLNKKQRIQLYKVLHAYHEEVEKNSSKALFHFHLFDIEDHVFREVCQDILQGEEYKTLLKQEGLEEFAQKIEKIQDRSSRFYDLEPKEGKKIERIADCQIKKEQVKSDRERRPVKVVKLALENERNFIGGVGAVLMGLKPAHQKLATEKVYSLHPLYTKDKPIAREFEFQGLITHQYQGKIVCSSVYKDKRNQEYTLVPDPAFRDIFNVPLKEGTYASTYISPIKDRVLYFGSASSAFMSLYRGREGDKSIDIVHCDSFPVSGVTFPLLLTLYDKLRLERALIVPKKLVVMHSKEFFYCSTGELRNVGWEDAKGWRVDLVKEGMRVADKIVFVSSQAASQALSHNPFINMDHQEILLGKEDKITSIRNGVNGQKFDVTNEEVFKDLALKRTFDEQGIETTDYVGYRAKLRKMLYEGGYIANSYLPLVVYVGRYSFEKGVSVLTEVVKESKTHGVQFATIGINVFQDYYVKQLKQMEETSHKNCLKVYATLEEQRAPFVHNGVTYPLTVSQVIQAAADMRVMTSFREACGLVAMEGQCAGSLLIAPHIDGLKDFCKPEGFSSEEGKTYSLQKEANAICYQDPANVQEANRAFSEAVKIWKEMSMDERNELSRRLRNCAIPNYSWYYQDPDTHEITGAVVAYHKLYQKLGGRVEVLLPDGKPALVPPVQAPINPIPFDPNSLTIWQRIYLFFKRWFEYLFF